VRTPIKNSGSTLEGKTTTLEGKDKHDVEDGRAPRRRGRRKAKKKTKRAEKSEEEDEKRNRRSTR
jgi:hypothetical protein